MSMSNNSFASESLTIECILFSNEISYSLKSLIDIEAADYSFINEVIMHIVYDQLQIESLTLIKIKSIQKCYKHAQSFTEMHIFWVSLDFIKSSAHLLSVYTYSFHIL